MVLRDSRRASRLDALFGALADKTRREILLHLRDAPGTTAGVLAEKCPEISRPAVSRHLRILREAGLVVADDIGRTKEYRLDPGVLREVYAEWLREFEPLWEPALRRLKARVEGTGGGA